MTRCISLGIVLLAVSCTGEMGIGGTGEPGGPRDGLGGGDGRGSRDGGPETSPASDAGSVSQKDAPGPNWDAFFANDPPPKSCGPDGGSSVPLPGGTPECPADKNREGCPCTTRGASAPCWPGLRVNRNHGVCKDGTTTCVLVNEIWLRWGPCSGYVLPTPGFTKGPEACGCFSKGKWQIDNSSPCFVTYQSGEVWAVSTYLDGAGQAHCPDTIAPTPPPSPQPGYPWSKNRLTVDCTGRFKLCYTIKAGDPKNPAATDCVVGQSCTEAWYGQQNVTQELPPLPAWTGSDPVCAAKFYALAGYGEMSVTGLSVECEKVDDGAGNPRVFLRIPYCQLKCAQNPTLPECQNCGNGGSGQF